MWKPKWKPARHRALLRKRQGSRKFRRARAAEPQYWILDFVNRKSATKSEAA